MPHQSKTVDELVTVLSKRRLNGLFHALSKRTSSTQVTLSLLRNANVTVAGSRRAVHDLTGRSYAETLLGPLMGFHFVGRHPSPHYLKVEGSH